MMVMRLLLLCLTGHVFAKELPDVDCLVVHLKYVHCSWNKEGTPEINYTFYSRFENDKEINCTTYLTENNMNIGCNQPYENNTKRFHTFHTKLVDGKETILKKHELKNKVWLYPPVNLTVQNGSDFNLWFYWNQTHSSWVESEVRFRTNNKKWETSKVSTGRQFFCINLPSSNSRYEVQVRSRLESFSGESPWSNWSEPVVWGSKISTDPNQINVPMFVWTSVLCILGTITLIILVMVLMHYERRRIIPEVPKSLHDIEVWLPSLKLEFENLKANYNECACPVSEYCEVSESESSDGSTCSVITDQTNCSVFNPVNESEDQSTSCSSSANTVTVSSETEHVSV